MAWEQDVECIVMLAGVVEGGRKKCEQYWPLKTNHKMTLKEFEIEAVKVSIDDPYDTAIRTTQLQVRHIDSDVSRVITHIQYVEWPDHGVPSVHGFTKLLNLYRATLASEKNSSSYQLIHCSAGVGRTGVFVMVNIMLEKVSSCFSLQYIIFLLDLVIVLSNFCDFE